MTNLKYLDEDITVTVINIPLTYKGIYPYTVYARQSNGTVKTLFYGNTYLSGTGLGTLRKTFNITDFCKEERFIPTSILGRQLNTNIILLFYVVMTLGVTTYTSNTAYVCLNYRYPTLDPKMSMDYINYDAATTPAVVSSQVLSGKISAGDPAVLLPRIPHKITLNYGLPLMISRHLNNIGYTYTLRADGAVSSQGTSFSLTSAFNQIYTSNSLLFTNPSYHSNLNYINIWLMNETTEIKEKVAVADYPCDARFYLAWEDRSGGFQSQPFNKIETYSETISTKEVVAYNYKRKLNNVQILPKWVIQTDWINEYYYPYYEQIFQSPSLILYDSELDLTYSVIATDKTFTLKTFLNLGKKLFNLSLTLELDKKQNIIY